MGEFQKLWPDGPLFTQADHFPLGTDSVLLADFTPVKGARRGIDLGCGSGVIALLLLLRAEKLHMTGLELSGQSAQTARENLAANALDAQDPARAAARGELSCTLDELCGAAAYLCRSGGRFCLVHKPERLSEAFCCMSAQGLEPKRLRLVCAEVGRGPSLVLIEARRGARPGLAIEPSLFLREADGAESAEVRRIYRKE